MKQRNVSVALAFALALSSCIVRTVHTRPLTGTCEGACEHYARCKGGITKDTREACLDECPGVFADRESLMAFESLSCPNAVDYVEGPSRRPPGTRPHDANAAAPRHE